jgi:hypothetical protein
MGTVYKDSRSPVRATYVLRLIQQGVVMRISRITAVILLLFVAAPAIGMQDVLRDPEGQALALIVDCSSCQEAGEAAACQSGVENGFHEGLPCGRCLIDANFGKRISLPYNSIILGRLKDENGKPVAKKFVRVSLPNSWGVRTRTREDGSFVVRLGPTVDSKSKTLVKVDLGDRTVRGGDTTEMYFLFMLPPEHEACKKN